MILPLHNRQITVDTGGVQPHCMNIRPMGPGTESPTLVSSAFAPLSSRPRTTGHGQRLGQRRACSRATSIRHQQSIFSRSAPEIRIQNAEEVTVGDRKGFAQFCCPCLQKKNIASQGAEFNRRTLSPSPKSVNPRALPPFYHAGQNHAKMHRRVQHHCVVTRRRRTFQDQSGRSGRAHPKASSPGPRMRHWPHAPAKVFPCP